MKNNKINIKTITIIVLLGIIISLIFYILNMKNISIQKQEIIKEQLETNNSNSYVDMETHLSELSSKQQEINNMQNLSGQVTATEGQILKNYTAYKDGKLITGTMANNGAVTKMLNAGESYTIPTGYHNGSGKVTANSLESQTQATATASDILSGKTAWVNGNLITGNIEGSGKITVSDVYCAEYNGHSPYNTSLTLEKGEYIIIAYASSPSGTTRIYKFSPVPNITTSNIKVIEETMIDEDAKYVCRVSITEEIGTFTLSSVGSWWCNYGILAIKIR